MAQGEEGIRHVSAAAMTKHKSWLNWEGKRLRKFTWDTNWRMEGSTYVVLALCYDQCMMYFHVQPTLGHGANTGPKWTFGIYIYLNGSLIHMATWPSTGCYCSKCWHIYIARKKRDQCRRWRPSTGQSRESTAATRGLLAKANDSWYTI